MINCVMYFTLLVFRSSSAFVYLCIQYARFTWIVCLVYCCVSFIVRLPFPLFLHVAILLACVGPSLLCHRWILAVCTHPSSYILRIVFTITMIVGSLSSSFVQEY